MRNTEASLKWIVGLLNKEEIPFGQIKYFDKENKVWVDFPNELDDVRIFDYLGMKVPVVNEIKLMINKKQLSRGVDRKDYKMILSKLLNQWFSKKYD